MRFRSLANKRTAPRTRHGVSLVETIAAVALTAGTLAPALAVMRDAMALSREVSERSLLANYAVRTMEEQAALTMQSWSPGNASGNFAGDGYATLRYVAVRSDNPANGGLLNRLMAIQVTAFSDENANSTADANELKVVMQTKVARLVNYVNAPN